MKIFQVLSLVLVSGTLVALSVNGKEYSPNPTDQGSWMHLWSTVLAAVAVVLIGGALYRLTEIPHVGVPEKSYKVDIRGKVMLECSISAFPWITTVSWRHQKTENGGTTTTVDMQQEKYSGSTPDEPHLIIKEASKTDEGSYICTVSNWFRKGHSAPIRLTVIGDFPSVEILESSYSAVVGERVKLKCSVSALPPIESVSWQRISPEGPPVTLDIDQKKYSGSHIDEPHLAITGVSKDDEGEYLCSVSNLCGERKSVPTTLTVEGDIPSVEILKDKYTALIGDEVKLECSVTALPRIISLSWHRISPGGRPETLEIDQRKYSRSKLDDSHLIITSVSKDDEGEYFCSVSNLCGEMKSLSTKLTVEGDLPKLIMSPKTYSKTEGENVILKCNVIARPPAWQIKWKQGEREIAIDNDKYNGGILQSPSLIIANTEHDCDEGVYTCEVHNLAGKQSDSVKLTIVPKRDIGNADSGRDLSPEEQQEIDEYWKRKIPEKINQERIVLRHGKMVNTLSDYIFPEENTTWEKFLQLLKAYASPREICKTLHGIVEFLMQMERIKYGDYKILHEVVGEIHKQAASFIQEAESDIEMMKKGGVPGESHIILDCTYDGDYESEEQVKGFVSQIAKKYPDIKHRITAIGRQGSIALRFTIEEAKSPKDLSALYLAEQLKAKLNNKHNKGITLEDETGQPLELKNEPEIKQKKEQGTEEVNGDDKDTPIVRLSKGHYQYMEGQTAALLCNVIPSSGIDYFKWFRIKDGETKEITIDNERYFGGLKSPSLAIRDIKKADSGLYLCRASNRAGEAESNSAFVDIFSSEPDDETDPPSGDDAEPDNKPFYPRLCHDIKWPNAASYGFDLDENREDTGHYVKTVNEDSPAETACLKTGDRVIEVNGVNIESNSLQEVIRKVKAGEDIKLLVVDRETNEFYKSRGIKVHSLLEEVRYHRSDPPQDPGPSDEGMPEKFYPRLCHVIKRPYFSSFGFALDEDRGDTGHYVKTVNEDSPAETACLKTGDRIIEVNGVNIESDSLQEVIRNVKFGEETKLLVLDSETDDCYKSRGIKVHNGLKEVRYKMSNHTNSRIAAAIEVSKKIIQEETDKGFVHTKSFNDAQQKLLENGTVILKGNPGDGKTTTALHLSHQLSNQRQGRQQLLIRNIEDLDMVATVSQCIVVIDEIFGEKDMCEKDVFEWEKRVESVLPANGEDGNFLIITVSNHVFNSLDKESSRKVFIESNIIDLSSNEYKIESERMDLLEFYEPKSFSWTEEEKKGVVKSGIVIGFPLCCRLFRDNPTFQGERGKFFERPFPFLNKMLSKVSSFAAIVYLFLCGGEIRKNDLDPKGKTVNKTLLEESFEIDFIGVDQVRTILTDKEKIEAVQKNLDSLLDVLVVKENDQSGDGVYRFLHGSIHDAVAVFYGNKTPNSYIKNCPRKSLLYLTTSKSSPNLVTLSPDLYTDMHKRLLQEIDLGQSLYPDDNTIASLDLWTDGQFLQGFIKWLYDSSGLSKIEILNSVCSSGMDICASYLLSEGVEPDVDTPFCVVKGGNVKLLQKLLTYDVTLTARSRHSNSSHATQDINVLHEACLLEREHMVNVLCEAYPHLVHGTDTQGRSTLDLAAITGNLGIFQTIETTTLLTLVKVEDGQHKCELLDGHIVHRHCACAQYMSELVNIWGNTVLHTSCKYVTRDICLYVSQSYPSLTSLVDKDGSHCLHYLARYSSDEDTFIKCETQVKKHLESEGRHLDFALILDNDGRTVLHMSCIGGHRAICFYLCNTYPELTRVLNKAGWHSLHYIARYTSDVNMFSMCESTYKVETILESQGRTVLHLSCFNGHKELCLHLCEFRPVLTRVLDGHGKHFLHYLARYTEDVDFFKKCEAHVKRFVQSEDGIYNVSTIRDNEGRTVLHACCKGGNKELFRYLALSYPELTADVDRYGKHCLHYLARYTSDGDFFKECEIYVKQGIHSILDHDGRTVLHMSCIGGQKDICLYLCDSYPALTTVVDKLGRHCLHYIARYTSDVKMFKECETFVKQFLESPEKTYDISSFLDQEEETVLHASGKGRFTEICKYLCESYPALITKTDSLGRTVLHKGCESGNKKLCLYLCQICPALTAVKDNNGLHCLHYIASYTTDVDMFRECETRVKRYHLESTGHPYDITTVVGKEGHTVLDRAKSLRWADNKDMVAFLAKKFEK